MYYGKAPINIFCILPENQNILFTSGCVYIELLGLFNLMDENLPGPVSTPTDLCMIQSTVRKRNYMEITGVSCQMKRMLYSKPLALMELAGNAKRHMGKVSS